MLSNLKIIIFLILPKVDLNKQHYPKTSNFDFQIICSRKLIKMVSVYFCQDYQQPREIIMIWLNPV